MAPHLGVSTRRQGLFYPAVIDGYYCHLPAYKVSCSLNTDSLIISVFALPVFAPTNYILAVASSIGSPLLHPLLSLSTLRLVPLELARFTPHFVLVWVGMVPCTLSYCAGI